MLLSRRSSPSDTAAAVWQESPSGSRLANAFNSAAEDNESAADSKLSLADITGVITVPGGGNLGSLKKAWASGGKLSKPTLAERERDNIIEMLRSTADSAQAEVTALKEQLATSQHKLLACEAEYETLLQELKLEGNTLKSKDKARFRKALQDVRDYEMYKTVMESTMIKIQEEMQSIAADNDQLKKENVQLKMKVQKHISDELLKDRENIDAKKLVAATNEKLEEAEREIKKLVKARDVAVSTVSKVKGDTAKKVSDMQRDLKEKEEDNVNLRKRLADSLKEVQSLRERKKAIEAAYSQDSSILRGNQSNTISMLIQYQEENDTLRAALTELADAHTHGPLSTISSGGKTPTTYTGLPVTSGIKARGFITSTPTISNKNSLSTPSTGVLVSTPVSKGDLSFASAGDENFTVSNGNSA